MVHPTGFAIYSQNVEGDYSIDKALPSDSDTGDLINCNTVSEQIQSLTLVQMNIFFVCVLSRNFW